ncbi:hypothetical protein [Arenimonas alkanexedens]
MNHANRFGFLLLAAALVSGCDILEKIPLTPADARRAAGKFGLATREKLEETPEGSVYRLSVKASKAASWLEADAAMWTDLKHTCPQGQLHENLSAEPDGLHTGAQLKPQPAGTLFVRTVRCAPKLAFEFDIAAGVAEDVAYQEMYESLVSTGTEGSRKPMVTMLYANRFAPRYQQIQSKLGAMLHMRLADCPEGVAIRNLTLGVMPPPPDASNQPRVDVLLGFTTECVATPAASAATPATGS